MITSDKTRPETPAEAAREARAQLSAARALLFAAGFEQVRVDQLQCGPIMVETGYVYGETRLTVHKPGLRRDFRLTGYNDSEFEEFRNLIAV